MAALRDGNSIDMPHLPAELWLHIFAYIHPTRIRHKREDPYYESRSARLDALTSVALTCKTFSQIVQPVLYTYIGTQLQSTEQLYELAVTLIKQPHLRGYVREAYFEMQMTDGKLDRATLQTLLPYALDLNCSAQICRSLLTKLPYGGPEAIYTILLALCSDLRFLFLHVTADDPRLGPGLPFLLILESAELPCNSTRSTTLRPPVWTINGTLSNQSNFRKLSEVQFELCKVGGLANVNTQLAPHIISVARNETFELPKWADIGSVLLLPALKKLSVVSRGNALQLNIAPALVGKSLKLETLDLDMLSGNDVAIVELVRRLPALKELSMYWDHITPFSTNENRIGEWFSSSPCQLERLYMSFA